MNSSASSQLTSGIEMPKAISIPLPYLSPLLPNQEGEGLSLGLSCAHNVVQWAFVLQMGQNDSTPVA